MPGVVKALAATAFVSTLGIVYGRTIAGLWREWISSPDTSYGLILLVVALSVAWSRRASISQHAADGRGVFGLALLVAGLLLYIVGQLGADVFLTRTSLIVILAGTVWFAGGAGSIRAAAAPLVFLLIAIPLPALVVNAVTLPL